MIDFWYRITIPNIALTSVESKLKKIKMQCVSMSLLLVFSFVALENIVLVKDILLIDTLFVTFFTATIIFMKKDRIVLAGVMLVLLLESYFPILVMQRNIALVIVMLLFVSIIAHVCFRFYMCIVCIVLNMCFMFYIFHDASVLYSASLLLLLSILVYSIVNKVIVIAISSEVEVMFMRRYEKENESLREKNENFYREMYAIFSACTDFERGQLETRINITNNSEMFQLMSIINIILSKQSKLIVANEENERTKELAEELARSIISSIEKKSFIFFSRTGTCVDGISATLNFMTLHRAERP